MAAVILNYLYKYDGVFALTEGQVGADSPDAYFREFKGPLYTDTYGRFTLKLDSLGVYRSDGDGQKVSAFVSHRPTGTEDTISAEIVTNRPYVYGDIEFHYGQLLGYSPELHVSDSLGETIFRSFVRLAARPSEDGITHADFLVIPRRDIRVDIEVQSENRSSLSPIYKVSIARSGQIAYDADIAAGESFTYEDMTISIPRTRRWCYIDVVTSPFLNLIFVGFWTGLAGLAASLAGRVIGKKGN
jgi:hypothetical protein